MITGTFDWIMDIVVCVDWFIKGAYGYASFMVFFIFLGGLMTIYDQLVYECNWTIQNILMLFGFGSHVTSFQYICKRSRHLNKCHNGHELIACQEVPGSRRDPGPNNDRSAGIKCMVCKFRKDFSVMKTCECHTTICDECRTRPEGIPENFLWVRFAETVFESLPSAAFQLYVLFASDEYSTLNYVSLVSSIVVTAFGLTNFNLSTKDPDSIPIRAVIRTKDGALSCFVCIMADFLWRTIPLVLFAAHEGYEYWNIPIVLVSPIFITFLGEYITWYCFFNQLPDCEDPVQFVTDVISTAYSIIISMQQELEEPHYFGFVRRTTTIIGLFMQNLTLMLVLAFHDDDNLTPAVASVVAASFVIFLVTYQYLYEKRKNLSKQRIQEVARDVGAATVGDGLLSKQRDNDEYFFYCC